MIRDVSIQSEFDAAIAASDTAKVVGGELVLTTTGTQWVSGAVVTWPRKVGGR